MTNNKNLSFVSLKDLPKWKEIIESIHTNSAQSWIWNTNEMFEFRDSCLKEKYKTMDLSFVVYLEGQAIGFFFMLAFKEASYFTASFDPASLYWPCFLNNYSNNLRITRETFSYIDKICAENNIGSIKIISKSSSLDFKIYCEILAEYKYLDESYESHIVNPKEFTLSDLRPKYRQMIKKYSDKFFIKILNSEDISDTIVQKYYELHVLDSGSKHRDISTYFKQFDILRKGGFAVCAFNKSMEPVGMLQILLDKGETFEASVAINPEFREFYVSHMLKQYAIQNMKNLDIDIYELGPTAYCPTWARIPTEKNYGINLFKEGWSRGKTRKTYSALKFYNQEALNSYFLSKKKEIETYLYHF